jgi:hypothetical protein
MRSRAGSQTRRLRAMMRMWNEKSRERMEVFRIGSLTLNLKVTESEVRSTFDVVQID